MLETKWKKMAKNNLSLIRLIYLKKCIWHQHLSTKYKSQKLICHQHCHIFSNKIISMVATKWEELFVRDMLMTTLDTESYKNISNLLPIWLHDLPCQTAKTNNKYFRPIKISKCFQTVNKSNFCDTWWCWRYSVTYIHCFMWRLCHFCGTSPSYILFISKNLNFWIDMLF